MANTYHQIKIQAVFAVKYRESLILPHFEEDLHNIVGSLINETGCKSMIVNGCADHIHCLFGLKPTVAISDLMKSVKAKSSKYINENLLTPHRFEWQSGYGAFSYNQNDVDEVYHYILNQKQHHQNILFNDEYIDLLKTHLINFEEEYIFEEVL